MKTAARPQAKALTLKALAGRTEVQVNTEAKSRYDGSLQVEARLRAGDECVGAATSLLLALLKLEVAAQAGRPEYLAAACASDNLVWLEACEGAEHLAMVGMMARAVVAFRKMGDGK
jgi:hypothetical protein